MLPRLCPAVSAAVFGCAVVFGASPAVAAKRHIVVTAVEPKGGVTVDKEPFPATPLPEGGGYVLKKPDRQRALGDCGLCF